MRKIYQENLTLNIIFDMAAQAALPIIMCRQLHCVISTFIPCGVWEAVEILEGLLKNESDLQPKIIHADTQGQSTVVFAIAYLLGISSCPESATGKISNFIVPTKQRDTNTLKLIQRYSRLEINRNTLARYVANCSFYQNG